MLVKGGHLPGVGSDDGGPAPARVADVLFDGREVTVLARPHVDTPNTHGTGCSLSAAIAARLASGSPVDAAITEAKDFVHAGLCGGASWRLGAGHGPLDHFGWASVGDRPLSLRSAADAKWPGPEDPATSPLHPSRSFRRCRWIDAPPSDGLGRPVHVLALCRIGCRK